jgi:hypothetical protein
MKKVILGLLLLCTLSNAKITYGDRIHVDFGRGNGFDGIVQDIRGNMLRVKVIDVQLKGFFVLYLNPSTCTGNEILNKGDRKLIWIRKTCVE